MKRPEWIAFSFDLKVILALLLLGWSMNVACLELKVGTTADGGLESSRGLKCEINDDCWDGLACENEVCGGGLKESNELTSEAQAVEPTPEKITAPPEKSASPSEKVESPVKEQDEPSGSTEVISSEQNVEVLPEKVACSKSLPFPGFCQKDEDCCPGQACKSFSIGQQQANFCAECAVDADCPQNTKCCKFGATGVCAGQCQAP